LIFAILSSLADCGRGRLPGHPECPTFAPGPAQGKPGGRYSLVCAGGLNRVVGNPVSLPELLEALPHVLHHGDGDGARRTRMRAVRGRCLAPTITERINELRDCLRRSRSPRRRGLSFGFRRSE
jgi:hypothetical protein